MSEMSPAEAIFFAALERAPGERAAFLDQACAGDAALRERIDKMLAAQSHLGAFLDPPQQDAEPAVGSTGPYETPTEVPGAIIAGKYKLLQRIGEGGMGSVWMADQLEPVKRRVAVKLIRSERGSSRVILARFEAERQAIALMDHPHIAKLLDAGTTGGPQAAVGRPYFVMELVKGIPLNDFCDEHKLSVGDRLQLFLQICSAVQHAHQKGIIHRDLKPTNILVEAHDDKPVPKIIDFGLAKALSGQPLTEHTLFTGFGTVAGTPLYMAPEQAKFNAIDIDTRADIYALGVILYELLTGTTPIERQQLKKGAFDEILRVIRESEPPTPSKRLSSSASEPSVAANRQMEPLKLCRFLRGELDWIVMKALAKERDRRYETANGFAKDIERFLNHEPVLAGPPSAAYKLRKFVRRNRPQVIAGSLLLLALLAGIAGATFGLFQVEQRRAEADRARADEAEQRSIAQANEAKALLAAEAEKTAKEREAEQRKKAERARDRTREALDDMTSSVTWNSLTTQKELSAEQKKFLTEVLTYYQEFAGEKADDEKSRARTALAATRLGFIEYRLGRNVEAVAAYRLAREGFEKLAAEFPGVPTYRHELARSHHSLGSALTVLGKRPKAEEQYREAVAIGERLAAEFPAVPVYRRELAVSHYNLGFLLANLGKRPEAGEQYRQALAIQEKLAGEFPDVPGYRQELAMSHNNLGILLVELGKRMEAEEQYRKALAIQERLAAEFPAVPGYCQSLARSHNNLGNLLVDLGKRPEAEEQYREALAIKEKLASAFPVMPEYRQELAMSHHNLGILLKGLGKRTEAEEHHRKGLDFKEKLASDFPAVPEYRQSLATSHTNLGILLIEQGKRPEAEEQYRKALAIQEKLVGEFPAVPAYQVELGGSYCNYGRLIRDGGMPEPSLAWFEKAIRTLTAVYEQDRRLVRARQFLRNSHGSRAEAYDRLQKYAEAVKDWEKSIELSQPQEQSGPRAARALSRLHAGQVAEAVAEVADLTKSSNWNAGHWYDFACVYAVASGKITHKKSEYADRAMELLRKAVQAGYNDAAHMRKDTDLDSLRERDDFKKLIAELEKRPPPKSAKPQGGTP